MSSTIIINFYDSVANIPLSLKTLSLLKVFIAEKFQLIPSHVEEFDFYYFNETDEKVFITNNLELVRSQFKLKSLKEENKRVIYVGLREGSRLYREMFFNEENINEISEDSPSQIEKIREQIVNKEKELKEILEKERIEREKKEAEEKKNSELIDLAIAKQEQNKRLALELLANQSEMIRQKAREESEMLEKRIKENKAKEKEVKEKEVKKEKKEKKEEVKPLLKEPKKDDKKIEDPFHELQKITKNMNKYVTKLVEKAFEKNELLREKKKPKQEKPIHEGVRCDGCQQRNISGIRYKCTVCPDFDFCEECEEKNFSSHLHPFVKIRVPNYKLNVKVELAETNKNCSTSNKEETSGGYLHKIVSNVNFFINSLRGTNYKKQAQELKGKYDLESFEETFIAKVLAETKGDEDQALLKLFK